MAQQQSAEEAFGAQVRQAREARGWTQDRLRRTLREVAGVDLSSTAMARLEGGKRPIRLNEVTALARVLELDLTQYGGRELRLMQHEAYEHAQERLTELRARLKTAELGFAELDIRASEAMALRAQALQHLDALRREHAQLEAAVRQYETGRAELARELGGEDGGQADG
ncbi:helix-turn-helix domain-containing protein [Micromonospora sp. S4605]|uniref:helix-turn-helix domain-containing protein n=1 Tax=Micromonospora sp. S4605 TaxID=1420897 RepID=UPI00130518C3|nr:helix-turn-helix transcriptional regulator [Micromonospora sp. S4605]